MTSQGKSIGEIEHDLSDILTQCGIGSFIDVKGIRKCVQELDPKESLTLHTIIFGLLDGETKNNKRLVDKLWENLDEYRINLPLKFLNDKSIVENMKERSQRGEENVVSLKIEEFAIEDWWDYYDEAMYFLRENKFSSAKQKFDKVFETLLKGNTTWHDIYRIYFNAGLAYLYAGDAFLGKECIKTALTLNPKYSFAQKELEKLENGKQFDTYFQLSLIKKMRDGIEKFRLESKTDHLDPNVVRQWSEEKILQQLSRFNVNVSKGKFIEAAKRLHSTDDAANELFYPQSTASGHDEDFVWMAADALWRRYCPDEPAVQTVGDIVKNAANYVSNNPPDKSVGNERVLSEYRHHLDCIRKFIFSEKTGFLEHWQKTFEFKTEGSDSLAYFLREVASLPEFEKQVTDIVSHLKSRIPDKSWDIVEIYLLINGKNDSWRNTYDELRTRYPYESSIPMYIGDMLVERNDFENAERFFLDAVRTVDLRAENERYPETLTDISIYEDYHWVLERLKRFYKENALPKDKQYNIKEKLKKVEEKKDKYCFSPPTEKVDNFLMDEVLKDETKKIADSVPMRYYSFLKKFEINFETEKDMHVSANYFKVKPEEIMAQFEAKGTSQNGSKEHHAEPPRRSRKIGRNEPCPCGSGKKYKKCCMPRPGHDVS